MDYVIKIPAMLGEKVHLYAVADGLARVVANAGGSFHQAAFDGALKGCLASLAQAAKNGSLTVCDNFGISHNPDDILTAARQSGYIIEYSNDANMTFAMNVFVRVHALNMWANEQGDTFQVSAELPWIDERGWNGLTGKEPPQLVWDSVPVSSVVAPEPVAAASDSPAPLPTVPVWSITRLQRFPGYRKPLFDFLKAASIAGQPMPTARDVLDAWKTNLPFEVAEVTNNGLKYYDAQGNTKPADLESIRKVIGRMTR
jgi:hypothetical protein